MEIEIVRAVLPVVGTLFGTFLGAGIAGFVALRVAGKQLEGQRTIALENARRERRTQRVKLALDAAERLITLATSAFNRYLGDRLSPSPSGSVPGDVMGIEAAEPLTVLRARSAFDPDLTRIALVFVDRWIEFVELDRGQERMTFLRKGSEAISDLATTYAALSEAADRYIDRD